MLEDIALNDLISGKPKVSDITQNEKIPPEGYKLTGRVNRLKNYNTYETIIFNQFTGKKMTLSIKAQDKEDIPLLILRLLTLGCLNTLFTSSSSSASPSEVPTFAEFAADIFADSKVEVAGKTGTAQVSDGANNAIFVGFAPYDNPKIAVVAIVEHGSEGYYLAPMVKEITNEYFDIYTNDAQKEKTQNIVENKIEF